MNASCVDLEMHRRDRSQVRWVLATSGGLIRLDPTTFARALGTETIERRTGRRLSVFARAGGVSIWAWRAWGRWWPDPCSPPLTVRPRARMLGRHPAVNLGHLVFQF